MPNYAKRTQVNWQRSRQEIENTLVKYGASAFGYATQETLVAIVFEFKGWRMRFTLPLKARKSTRAQDVDEYQREVNRRWRALALSIKAKLVAVEEQISTVETEFMGHIVLPTTNETVAEWLTPQLQQAYSGHPLPPLLEGPKEN